MTTVEKNRGTLVSERMAGSILPRVLTTFDMVAIFVAIVHHQRRRHSASRHGRVWLVGHRIRRVPCAVRGRNRPARRHVPR